jgi:hypothetical protein
LNLFLQEHRCYFNKLLLRQVGRNKQHMTTKLYVSVQEQLVQVVSNTFADAFNTDQTVSGTTGGSAVTITGSTAGHSITQAELPDITLQTTQLVKMEEPPANRGSSSGAGAAYLQADVPLGGSDSAHTHGAGTLAGSSHTHSFSDTFNLDVQYVDFIIANKD